MLKQLRTGVAAAFTVFMAACATVPEATEPPRPAEPDRPEPVEEPRREAPLRIGVVVSSTGSAVLQRYAEMVLDGARLGADQAGTDRRQVELVIRDDGGTAAGATRAVRELEAAGVRHIVGPLLDESVSAAASARSGEGTLIISPTAVAQPTMTRNVYALNVVDTRGATALGEYARRYGRVGVLYPRSPDQTQQARAFMEAYRAGGGAVTDAGFDPGSTNVTAQLGQLRQARVEAIFFPGTERHLQLVLPQIDYAGLGAVQMLGTETWLSDALRGAPQRVIEGAIVATPLWQDSPELAWQEFVRQYENRYRRSLDNPIAALGYDAVLLAVRAADGQASGDYRGATGVMNVQPEGITRKPFLVRIQSGRLVPVH
ncbi:MAG TPA: penicillin-binding protein activator [Longimicrobiales bacterium]|nr:penicillin-binding protein activator [Longimicrobiales bacterium]